MNRPTRRTRLYDLEIPLVVTARQVPPRHRRQLLQLLRRWRRRRQRTFWELTPTGDWRRL